MGPFRPSNPIPINGLCAAETMQKDSGTSRALGSAVRREIRRFQVVLRITKGPESDSGATLELEGRIVGEGATLLERECIELLEMKAAVRLDLAGVSFVDRAGIDALRRLSGIGVEIHSRSGPLTSVLEADGV